MARSSVCRRDVTAEDVRSILDYDEQTGLFVWKIGRGRSSVGKPAGTPDDGYTKIGFGNKIYSAHRLAWIWKFGEWPAGQIDHINGNGLDNRIENLRDVCASGNQQNLARPRRTRSPHRYLGVSWVESRQKWLAQIGIAGKTYNLGRYASEDDAKAIYQHVKTAIHPFSPEAGNNPRKAATNLAVTMEGLARLVEDARTMLVNRRA